MERKILNAKWLSIRGEMAYKKMISFNKITKF